MIDYGPGLLADVLADPDRDAPRLIYADWLDDTGDYDRAEFIRTQVALDGWDWGVRTSEDFHRRMKCQCQGCELRRRETELLGDHGGKWRDFGVVRFYGNRVRFVRGFVEYIETGWWPNHIHRVREQTPLRKVKLLTEPTGGMYLNNLPGNRRERFTRTQLAVDFPGLEFELDPNWFIALPRYTEIGLEAELMTTEADDSVWKSGQVVERFGVRVGTPLAVGPGGRLMAHRPGVTAPPTGGAMGVPDQHGRVVMRQDNGFELFVYVVNSSPPPRPPQLEVGTPVVVGDGGFLRAAREGETPTGMIVRDNGGGTAWVYAPSHNVHTLRGSRRV